MTWDDEKPFPPWISWWARDAFEMAREYSAKWTDEDTKDLAPRMHRLMYWVDDDYTDAHIMDALTRQARRGVKHTMRPLALWLEKDNDE